MVNAYIRIFILSCLFLTCSGGVKSAVKVTDSEVRSVLAERIDKGEKSVGIVVGIIDSEGRRIIAHGVMDKNSRKPVDGNTVYEIGSITKVFTATLLADMVAKGEVGLHDPIEKYLPPGTSIPERGGKKITLYHLTTHTSGLPRMPDNFNPNDPDNPYADYSVEQMLDFLGDYQLTTDIGTHFEYSNLGVGLLGYILSRKAGLTYEEMVTGRICRPLDMADTGIALSASQRERLTTGHNAGGEPVGNWDLTSLAGAGALRSTVNDMLEFIAANLDPSSTVLKDAIELTRKEWRDTDAPKMQVGLGWFLKKDGDSGIVWHNGGTGGYHSFIGFDLENKNGVVVLSNSANSIDDIGFHILKPEAPLTEVQPLRETVEISIEPYQDYAGEYELAPQAIFTVTTKDNHLYAQLTGQPTFEVYPESDSTFFYKVVDAQLTFVRNGEGQVTHLILHQNGINQKAPKRRKAGESLQEHREVNLEPEKLQKYVGKYELRPGFVLTVTLGDETLMVQATGQANVPIYAESQTRFFYKVVNAQIDFKVDNTGDVTGLTLFQASQELFAGKL